MRIWKRKSFKWMVIAVTLCGVMGLLWFTLIPKPFTYTDNGTSITITRWPDASGAVEIPPTVYGKPVTTIGPEAFARCTELTSITIPNSVTTIGDHAFDTCVGLNSIIIPPGVKSIGIAAFESCTSLTSITIPTSVTNIGRSTFWSCTDLTSITIPSSVTSIGDYAFHNCGELTSITILSGVTRIGDRAFDECSGLTAITVDPLNANYSSLDGVLFNKNQTTLIQCPGGKAGSVTIPAGVTCIGSAAFRDCGRLTSITIPTSVTSIGEFAFFSCKVLTSVTIPPGVTSIGKYAFSDCTSLTNVAIPASVTSIGGIECGGCTSLTEFTVDPHNANYSSLDGVLYNKHQTTLIQCPPGKTGSVTLSANVTTIEDNAFKNCTGLTSVMIPASLTSIGGIFDCTGLTEITVDSQNANYSSLDGVLYNKDQTKLILCPDGKSGSITVPSSVSNINGVSDCTKLTGINADSSNAKYSSVDGILYNKDQTILIQCPEGKVGSVTILAGVTRIEIYAFARCKSLTCITIPASVTSIGTMTFANCSDLTSVTIPSSVTSIGDYAFENCLSLTSIALPSSITSIGDKVFENCPSLTEITVDPRNANYSSLDGVLYNKKQTKLILCPKGKAGSITLPAGITSVDDSDFDSCTGLSGITVDPHNAKYSSLDGVLYNKHQTELILCPQNKSGSITVPYSVSSINYFGGCAKLTSISVDSRNANYSSLEGVLYNKNRTTLIRCPAGKVGSVTTPAGVTSIGNFAFTGCRGLTSVTISPGVTSIAHHAFSSCFGLTSVTIPASVTSISDLAFCFCRGLTSAYFHGNAPSLRFGVFYQASNGFTVYYLNGKTGFTSPKWHGYKAEVERDPQNVK